jgi:hypothetical protein
MIKDKNVILALGMFSLIIAILLGRYTDPSPVISFLEGLFYGLSFVLNIFSLILMRKNRNHNFLSIK